MKETNKLAMEARSYIKDRRDMIKRYEKFIPIYKKAKRVLKKRMNEPIDGLVDALYYREVMETYINRISNTINQETRELTIKKETRIMRLKDCFLIAEKAVKNDLDSMLSKSYFNKVITTKIEDEIVRKNILKIFNVKKDIIETYFDFLSEFNRKLPSIIAKERDNHGDRV